MSKKMLINASHPEENRVAIVVDGLLSELDIEIAGQEQTKGNIYKAVVVRVESGLQAAFVDYGAEKLGFLQIGEIHPNLLPAKLENKGRPRINDILKRGQEILVQIVKEERGNKGAALTTNLSVPGRYMVLMPDSTTKGVSRKIQDDPERKKLKRTMAELDLPERMGYIVRTAGIGKEKEELKRDFDYLVRLFEGIVARKDQVKAPSHLYQESNLVIRSIRDYFSTEMDEVLIDDQKVFQETKDFFALVMPELAYLVKQHRERRPIFSRYQIEEQIDGLAKNQIPLPSGGSIVIDQTEALVAIDVNSGKMSSESGIEATAGKTNLEAAAEVGRQLRLRDLGGLVVIDFIDMRDRKRVREVEQELRKSLKDDKAKVTVGRISQFGLMEMSRQRLKPTLSVGSYLECPHCQGKGRIKSAENQAVSLLRQIHAAASKGHIGHIEATVPIDVANDLLNSKRQSLVELEKRLNLKVSIIGHSDMTPGQLDIELHKREKNGGENREIAPVSHANQIESALAAAGQEEPTEPTAETTPQDAQAVPPPDGATTEQAAEGETGERKTRRRRRRRRRRNDRPADTNSQQTATEESAMEPSAETSEQPVAQPAESVSEVTAEKADEKAQTVTEAVTEEKPKRRRGRKPAAKKTETQTEAVAVADPAAETQTVETAPVEEKPKRRSRKPAPQKTDVAAAESEATEPATTAKPARRNRKPAAQKTAEPVTAKAQETPAESPAAEETAAAKPKRRAPQKTAKPAATATPEQPSEEKPKRRTRRTTKKVAEDAPAASVAATETATSDKETATPSAEKPKRQPRKTTKKPTEAKTEAATEATTAATTAAADTATAEKPKRRPGRPKKKPAEKDSTAVAAAETDATTEEKPKRRAAKPKKAATRQTSEKTAETLASAEKPKRRPGRPRKTPAPAATKTESDS